MIIEHKHLRLLRYCNKGAREFFLRHGLDWAEFMSSGLPEEQILATGDAMATRLVEFAHEYEGQQA